MKKLQFSVDVLVFDEDVVGAFDGDFGVAIAAEDDAVTRLYIGNHWADRQNRCYLRLFFAAVRQIQAAGGFGFCFFLLGDDVVGEWDNRNLL